MLVINVSMETLLAMPKQTSNRIDLLEKMAEDYIGRGLDEVDCLFVACGWTGDGCVSPLTTMLMTTMMTTDSSSWEAGHDALSFVVVPAELDADIIKLHGIKLTVSIMMIAVIEIRQRCEIQLIREEESHRNIIDLRFLGRYSDLEIIHQDGVGRNRHSMAAGQRLIWSPSEICRALIRICNIRFEQNVKEIVHICRDISYIFSSFI